MSEELTFTFAPTIERVCFNSVILELSRRERSVLHHLWEHDWIDARDICNSPHVAKVVISNIRRQLKIVCAPFIIKHQFEDDRYVLQPLVDGHETQKPRNLERRRKIAQFLKSQTIQQ